jgi:histidine triad (HIT) family protein
VAVPGCTFCRIVERKAPAEIVREWEDAVAFVPLNPVTEGHLLVVPRVHVADATAFPKVTGVTMEAAAELAREAFPCNLITSSGREATQTVFHLHVHVVPRRQGDGLMLPWSERPPGAPASA